MTIRAWLEALEGSAVGAAMRDSLWLYPAVETIHLLGLATLVETEPEQQRGHGKEQAGEGGAQAAERILAAIGECQGHMCAVVVRSVA